MKILRNYLGFAILVLSISGSEKAFARIPEFNLSCQLEDSAGASMGNFYLDSKNHFINIFKRSGISGTKFDFIFSPESAPEISKNDLSISGQGIVYSLGELGMVDIQLERNQNPDGTRTPFKGEIKIGDGVESPNDFPRFVLGKNITFKIAKCEMM